MRVVMYSPDAIGLGHMRRNTMIATEIVRQDPSATVALLIGSGAGAFFAVPRGIDTIKLPSVRKVAAEKWEPRTLNLSSDETLAVRAGLIRDVVLKLIQASAPPEIQLINELLSAESDNESHELLRTRQSEISENLLVAMEELAGQLREAGNEPAAQRLEVLLSEAQQMLPS